MLDQNAFDIQIQRGPCKICGAVDYLLSFGGPDICPVCDCYGCCARCKLLIQENNILKKQLEQYE